ncbi:MAG: hypothetical protein AAF578_10125 [Pseudomonadota bacterium]
MSEISEPQSDLPYLNHGDAPTDDTAKALLLAQHEYLRNEISHSIADIMRNPTIAAVASGGVWAWLFASDDGSGVRAAAAIIPLILSLLLIWRDKAVRDNWIEIAHYCLDIERRLGTEGWEHHCFSKRKPDDAWTRNFHANWTKACLWLIAMLNAIAFLYVAFWHID